MGKKDVLAVAVVLLFVISVISQFLVYWHVSDTVESYEQAVISGKSSKGIVTLCFNNPPFINNTCPTVLNQSQPFSCQVNVSDIDPASVFNFTSVNLTPRYPFNISNSGLISFTPNQSMIGNHSMNITVYDNSGCSNGYYSDIFNFSVVDVNDPPVWMLNIPDQEVDDQVLVIAFDLDDYVYDPDGDALSFVVIGTVPGLNISVISGNRVSIYASSCLGTVGPIWIVAAEVNTTEMYATSSNQFYVTVNCASGGDGDDDDGDGGGGGGSSRPCIPDWQCSDWGPCYGNGTQMRRCIDYNGCDADDYIRYQWRECELPPTPPCEERWECTSWSICYIDPQTGLSIQNRTCTDLENCGTYFDQPNETRSCTIEGDIIPQGEEKPVEDEFPLLTYILIIAIILLAILFLVYKLYKKQIREILVRVGWHLTKKRRKQILLSDEVKANLLKEIFEVEKKIGKTLLQHSAFKVANIIRQYFAAVYNLQHEFTKEDFSLAFNKKRVDKILKKIFPSFFELSYNIEFSKYKVLPYELLTVIDELRLIIFQTSNVTKKDGAHQVKHRITVSKNKIDQVFTQLSNSMLPTQFNESVFGKRYYMKALKMFEDLNISEQERVYPYLQRLFEEINYVSHLVRTAKLT